MAGPAAFDPAIGTFQDEVEKVIVVEAKGDAYFRPSNDDAITLEIRAKSGAGAVAVRTWTMGRGASLELGGLNLERCARTMRFGEECTVQKKASADETHPTLRLKLIGLERTEDLTGGQEDLMRTIVQDASGFMTPQPGMELKIRYAWCISQDQAEVAAADSESDPVVCTIELAAATPEEASTVSASSGVRLPRDLGNLTRTLLRKFGVAVVSTVQGGGAAVPSDPRVLKVMHGEAVLFSSTTGATIDEVRSGLESVLLSRGIGHASREIAVHMEETKLICDEPDWLPEPFGFNMLADMREGQRFIVRAAPDLVFADATQAYLGLNPSMPELALAKQVEYDIEILRAMPLEDISLDKRKGVMRKCLRDGEGYDKPVEGANVTVKVEVRSGLKFAKGKVLVKETEISFEAGSSKHCCAIAETVLTMKKGEVIELLCTDPEAWADKQLGLTAGTSDALAISMELLSFDPIDIYGLGETKIMELCANRKELGGEFVKAQQWRRALVRYQFVINTLLYIDHWKEPAAKTAAQDLRLLCRLNCAACLLKLEEWKECQKSCEAVLKQDGNNVKALFRLGQSLKALQDYREAEKCFKKVHDMDPDNKENLRMLHMVRLSIKEERVQQKQFLSRMAKGVADDTGAGATQEVAATSPAANVAKVAKARGMDGEAATDALDDDDTWVWVTLGLIGALGAAYAIYTTRRKKVTFGSLV